MPWRPVAVRNTQGVPCAFSRRVALWFLLVPAGLGTLPFGQMLFGVFSLLPLGVAAQFLVAAFPVIARGASLSCFAAKGQFDWVGGGVARTSRVASGPRGGASGGCLGASLCGSSEGDSCPVSAASSGRCLGDCSLYGVWFRTVCFQSPLLHRDVSVEFHCEVCGGFTRVGCPPNRARGWRVPSRGWIRGKPLRRLPCGLTRPSAARQPRGRGDGSVATFARGFNALAFLGVVVG